MKAEGNKEEIGKLGGEGNNTDLIAAFVGYLRHELNRSRLTVTAYEADIRQFVAFLEASAAFDAVSVTVSDIRAWLVEMTRCGDSPRTLRRKTQSLRAFYRFLMRRSIVKTNPAADIVLAKTDRPLPQFVREEEMEQVLSADSEDEADVDSVRDHLVMLMLYSTGMRRAELLGLRDSDIDFYRGEIRVTGKRNKQRVIPMAPELADEISRYIALRDKETDEKFRVARGEYLFHGPRGHLSEKTIATVVARMLAGTSVVRKSPHVLRHTFATALLNNGAGINSVKELLGHASVATTQIYTHVSFAQMRNDYLKAHPRARHNSDDTTEPPKS